MFNKFQSLFANILGWNLIVIKFVRSVENEASLHMLVLMLSDMPQTIDHYTLLREVERGATATV